MYEAYWSVKRRRDYLIKAWIGAHSDNETEKFNFKSKAKPAHSVSLEECLKLYSLYQECSKSKKWRETEFTVQGEKIQIVGFWGLGGREPRKDRKIFFLCPV